jgi:hypothetical protein
MAATAVDIELGYDRFLGDVEFFERLAAMLRRFAADWLANAHIYDGPRNRRPLDVSSAVAFRDAVLADAGELGPTYRRMVSAYGRGDERLMGPVEIRGATPI